MADTCIYKKTGTDQYLAIKAPNEFTVNIADLDAASTTRNAKGYMVRQRVRGGADAIRTLEFKWQNLSLADAKSIIYAFKDTYVTLKYPDPFTGAYRDAKFYVGDRKLQMKRLESASIANFSGAFVKELSFNCIER